jgi:Tol biopolymer transport system component/predicted Ser/Thr protein kinase
MIPHFPGGLDSMIGQTLNHYKVVSHLGRGGMGDVYVAEDTKLGRKVALKVLPTEMASDAERRARFEREAKAVAALNHPNIVTVYSVEQAGDVHFITMELVEGRTFSELLAEKRLPLNKLMEYAIAMADAVTGAHRKGITHRDVKPDNVMLADDGRLKVLDFGLAKVAAGKSFEQQQTAIPTKTVTQEGMILGTAAYMAPEQAEGKPSDARSDVFSLGVIFYQMATGERPFKGDTTISTITSILRDTPQSVTQLNKALPRHLGRIVKRCLEKDPELRYQTAQGLRNDLQGLCDEMESGELHVSDVSAAVAQPRTRHTGLVAGLAIVAVVAIGIAVVQFLGRGAAEGPASPSAALQGMEITRLTATGHSREATISPDGRYVAYVVDDAGEPSLWVTQVATGSKVLIVPPADVGLWDPIFSPDGDFIYYCRYEEPGPKPSLYRVPTLGGGPRKILDDTNGRVSFSPDGRRFVFNRSTPEKDMLVVANVDGTDQKVIATRNAPEGYDDPTWSPDGTIVAASLETFADGPQATVIAVPAEGGDERSITDQTWFGVGEIAWLPDGSGLIFTGENPGSAQLWEIRYPGGEARRVTNDLNSYHGVGLTADGTTLVTQLNESSYNLWTLSLEDGAQPVRITSHLKENVGQGLAWTPDGRIVHGSAVGGNWDLWVVDADGSNPTRLTSDQALNGAPEVTADGKYMVFLSNRAGTVNVFRADLDGGNPVQLTRGTLDVGPVVTPDGRWVVYLQPGDGRLYKVSIDGGESIEIRDRRGGAPAISPDGKHIAVSTYYEDRDRWLLDIVPFEGGDPIHTFDQEDTAEVRWAPDGEAVTFSRTEGGVANIWRLPLDGGEPSQVTHFEADFIQDYAWSPDGKRLVLSRGRTTQDIVLLKNFR